MCSQRSSDPGRDPLTDPEEPSDLPGQDQSFAGVGRLCPRCGYQNRARSQFCGDCGAPLGGYCSQCGRPIEAGLLLCEACSVAPGAPSASPGRCQSCGFDNEMEAKVCQTCGARLLVNCARCGSLIPASFRYCPRCGFQPSKLVLDRVAGRFEPPEHEDRRPLLALDFSSGLMIALIILSVVLMLYILLDI
jgi:predicted amidophosphoribosyltransferase